MSIFVRIKISGGHAYRQEVESYWDSAKRKHRQRYIRSLGRVDDFDERQNRAFDSAMRQAQKSYPEQFKPGWHKEQEEKAKEAQWSAEKFLAETTIDQEKSVAATPDASDSAPSEE